VNLEDSRDKLAEDFAWLCLLAKLQTPEEVQRFALSEWERAKGWIASNSYAPGSFLWCCDQYELEPDAVRRAIKERKA
jgi:hypothetical protein